MKNMSAYYKSMIVIVIIQGGVRMSHWQISEHIFPSSIQIDNGK